MKQYTGKTVEEALQAAATETGTEVDELIYIVSDKRKGLFAKKIVVEVYDLADVIRFAEDYVLGVVDALEIESTVNTKLDDQVIRITIDSTHNPILIGRNGKTLQALNELVKLAVSNHFHKRFRILLDINGYKDSKYSRLVRMARRLGHDVQKTKTTYTFDPMPADERRVVHNACSGMKNIRTESTGEGTHRQVQIIYVE
jgi:spoIIIJ-associated protein